MQYFYSSNYNANCVVFDEFVLHCFSLAIGNASLMIFNKLNYIIIFCFCTVMKFDLLFLELRTQNFIQQNYKDLYTVIKHMLQKL